MSPVLDDPQEAVGVDESASESGDVSRASVSPAYADKVASESPAYTNEPAPEIPAYEPEPLEPWEFKPLNEEPELDAAEPEPEPFEFKPMSWETDDVSKTDGGE